MPRCLVTGFIKIKIVAKDYSWFPLSCKEYGIPEPTTEYKFHQTRRWRLDFAWVEKKVAIEVNGGTWISGRHNRGNGYINDMEKMNALQMLGWRVLQFTPQQLVSNTPFEMLQILLK